MRFKLHDFRAAIVADDVHDLVLDKTTVYSAGDEAAIVFRTVTGETLRDLSLPSEIEHIQRIQ